MNSGERSTLDRESVKELLEGSQFDDSVHVEHQSDLRANVLRTFDDAQHNAEIVCPAFAKNRNVVQVIGIAATVAACMVGVVSIWFVGERDSVSKPTVVHRPGVTGTIDPLFVESLAQADALREGASSELFFDAVEICKQEHEARQLVSDATLMRLHHELSLPKLPVESPKG